MFIFTILYIREIPIIILITINIVINNYFIIIVFIIILMVVEAFPDLENGLS